jgi:hypothetical protein
MSCVGVDESAPPGAADPEVHRHLISFLRGLSGLDAALGRWRPDYGGLPARPEPDPGAEQDIASAHRLYASGLSFFAEHPELAWGLGEPSRDDLAAAITDARVRFGAATVPLDGLAGAPPEGANGGLSSAAAPGASPGVPAGAPLPAPTPQPAAPVPAPPPPEVRRGGTAAPRPASERPPRSGLLLWAGGASLFVIALIVASLVLATRYFLGPGPTAAPALPTAPPTTLPASAATVGPLPTLFGSAESCSSLPSGQVAPALAISSTSSGIGIDPASGYGTSSVSVTLSGAVGPRTPAFALVTAVLPYGATSPTSGSAIDRAGTVQLVAGWDGRHWYGGLRSWSGSAWSGLSNAQGASVDVVQNGRVVTVFWTGLTSGDRYGVVVATSGGCAAAGLSGGSPSTAYNG